MIKAVVLILSIAVAEIARFIQKQLITYVCHMYTYFIVYANINMSTHKRACGFVIFRQVQGSIEYLLMQTSYGNHHWTPPKGHVDDGETDFETALRETKEETGFVENDLNIFQDVKVELKYNVNGIPKTVIYWLAELINPSQSVRMSSEHEACKWLRLEQACYRARYTDMQNALEQFNEYIDKNVKKK
ncbi:hypothetical protein M0804_001850 [Polistes exclamans]|nr:hypothetical protein M0804_001850 [Polistes exclamans]